MTFKNATPEQVDAFLSTLKSGQYNLLLGAGSSMDSTNHRGELPSGEVIKNELCDLKKVARSNTLQRAFSLLTPEEIEKHITERFSDCVPGDTLKNLRKFIWKRIFTWNIDDAIQNEYKIKPKQVIITKHYNDEYVEASNLAQLLIVHLHGTVLWPEKGYVFSRDQYVKQITKINPWMTVLSNFIQSDPIIIAGTSLDEVDLDYYLAQRSVDTSRDDRGPSILVTRQDDAITEALCKQHNLLHFVGWASDFFSYCTEILPNPPTPEDLVPTESQNLLPDSLSKSVAMAFHSDFELVPATAQKALHSRFLYGHPPSWQDLAANYDISREVSQRALSWIDRRIGGSAGLEPLLLIADDAGTGKTTILRRLAFEMAGRGVRVLYSSALSRIAASTAQVLDEIAGPLLVVIDNLADHATAVAAMVGSIKKQDVAFLSAERAYRMNYLTQVLGDGTFVTIDDLSMVNPEPARLIDTYVKNAFIGSHKIVEKRTSFINSIRRDPIAIACCRIMNDFRPLERIVDDLIGDAKDGELERYITVSLSQFCFTGGLLYEVLLNSCEKNGIKRQFSSENPLPIAYLTTDRDYVVTENAVLAERILLRCASLNRERLLRVFTSLAEQLQPYVNRQAIRERTPEARLAGRLFDYDDITAKLLGDNAERFYRSTEQTWRWNSRYWEQVALMNLTRFHAKPSSDEGLAALEEAQRHALRAVAIENHPFGLSTLGKVLMAKILVPGTDIKAIYDQAFDHLDKAIEKENNWSRRAVQPYFTLFSGTLNYLKRGGSISLAQQRIIRKRISNVLTKFSRQRELTELADEVITALS
ncbi:MAG TPA: SIR2 family protein [Shinella sp.]|jgi:hypothetical protein|uniref:P-loop NTPase n=1 Tax=Shinella sp. TaxID=1870904 RepID=UPI002E124FA3|nr:SIR2 family protein [Shinella sp.]